MALIPYSSVNQTGATIFFQRHSQSGEGDDEADAVLGVVGLVDEQGVEIGSALGNKTILTATGTFSTSGDNTAIDISAASGYVSGDYVVIAAIRIQNESGEANTILIKDGATTISRIYTATEGSGLDRQYETGRELRLSADADIILNLSAANQIGYSIEFFLEQ
jgi:hypothetical protein